MSKLVWDKVGERFYETGVTMASFIRSRLAENTTRGLRGMV